MDISVLGLGYVGTVTAALLARSGHRVIGVDSNPLKVESLNAGTSPILEPGLQEIVSAMVQSGALRATCDTADAIEHSTLSLIAVGTPSRANGSLDLAAIETVCRDIAAALKRKQGGEHTVVVRSTVLPGTCETIVLPLLLESGRALGNGLSLCFNPEFLREGTSVKDYAHPPFTVIGAEDRKAGEMVAALYAGIDAPVLHVPLRVAEMVKYVCNTFHALKVTFANEIGRLCGAEGIDSHQVMDIICMDTKLNISRAYMKPGFAFGGSCLPKDLRALLYRAKERDVDLPLLGRIMESNNLQVALAMDAVRRLGGKRVALLGLSFKEGTDDVRESPMVALAEQLIGKGYDVRIFDEHVSLSRMIGANREFLHRQIPHIVSLLSQDLESTVAGAQVLVVADGSPRIARLAQDPPPGKKVLDLVRAAKDKRTDGNYVGLAW